MRSGDAENVVMNITSMVRISVRGPVIMAVVHRDIPRSQQGNSSYVTTASFHVTTSSSL